MKKLSILAFIWLIAFAKANADQTGISEEESTEKLNGFKSSSSSLQEQQSSLKEEQSSFREQQSSMKEEQSPYQEQQSSLKEQQSSFQEQQSSLQERQSSLKEQQSSFREQQSSFKEEDSQFQEEQSLAEEQKSTHQEQKSSFHKRHSSLNEEKTLFDQQQLSIEEQQSSLKEQQSSLKVQQSPFQEQQSSLREQQSSFQEQQPSFQEQQSLLQERKSIVNEQESFIKEQKSVTQEQQSLSKQQKFTAQEQQSTTFEKQQSGYNRDQSSLKKQESTESVNREQFIKEKQVKQKHQKNIREEGYSSVQQNEHYFSNTKKSRQESEHETQQVGQPESVWIGNTPDSHVYPKIIDINKKTIRSEDKYKSVVNKQDEDRTTNVVKKTNTKQDGQPESVWIGNTPDSHAYPKIIDINKKAIRSENKSKSVVNDQEEGSNTNFGRKNNTRQPDRPKSVWIGNTPDSNVYSKIIDVNEKPTNSKITPKFAVNKQEEDKTTNVVKKTNKKQVDQPESVWIGNTPDSHIYTKIIDLNKKAINSENISKSVGNKQEKNKTTNVVRKTNNRKSGPPESVWIGNTPDSHVYSKIIELNKKINNSENRSDSVVNKQEEVKPTNVVKKTNTKEDSQPESVWIGNTPDSHVYPKIIDLNKKVIRSENKSKSVVNDQEEVSNTNFGRKTNTRQSGRPESVRIGNTPDSNVYSKIIDVNEKPTSSKITPKFAVIKQEEDRTTNVVKKTDTKQVDQPESVWIGNTPDSQVYTKIIDLNKKAINSENISKSVGNKQEKDKTTNVVRKTNNRKSGQPESVWIGDTPDSHVYSKIIDLNKKRNNSENRAKPVVNKQEEDSNTNTVRKTNTRQPGQTESVWIGNTPDSHVYSKIIDLNKKGNNSENRSESEVNEQVEDSNTNIVTKTNTRQPGRPESVWIDNTPDSNVYTKIIDVNEKASNSKNTSKSVVYKQEEDRSTTVVKKTNTKQVDQPESVWIGSTPDSHVYTKIIDINKKATNSDSTATETLKSKSSSAAQVAVKSSQAKYRNKRIRPYPPRLTLRPKLPVKPKSNQPTQPVPVKQYRPRYNLSPKTGTKKPIRPKPNQLWNKATNPT